MSSSCLINGGGRTYRLDMEIMTKSSSILSEALINSTPLFISTKRARSPRKRPNQSSAEAAALLSTISPKLFSPTILRRANYYFPVLRLPSFPIDDDATLLLRETPSVEKLPFRLEPKMTEYSSLSDLPCFQLPDPGSPEFDAQSILGDEVDEGIDSMMGMRNLSMTSNCIKDCNLDCLMGFGFGISSNIRRADVVPKLIVTAPVKTKKKMMKKKKKKEKGITGTEPPEDGILEQRLWLKLDYDEVIKQWSGGSPFSGEAAPVESAADVTARLASIDLFPDVGGGALREASVQRYNEKQRISLFSKKTGYQVRKVYGDQRPRVKGRFVRTPSLLQETMAEES